MLQIRAKLQNEIASHQSDASRFKALVGELEQRCRIAEAEARSEAVSPMNQSPSFTSISSIFDVTGQRPCPSPSHFLFVCCENSLSIEQERRAKLENEFSQLRRAFENDRTQLGMRGEFEKVDQPVQLLRPPSLFTGFDRNELQNASLQRRSAC